MYHCVHTSITEVANIECLEDDEHISNQDGSSTVASDPSRLGYIDHPGKDRPAKCKH